ncbi:MAG: hypothetical protein V3T31_10795 [candidate division Zixibacteria bacterium]
MLLIGDVHGDIVKYQRLIKRGRSSLQVGDLGLGFPDKYGARMTNLFRRLDPKIHECHKVLRGNHDNPDVFLGHEYTDEFGKRHKILPLQSYLGDWGYLPDQDLFFMSGAFSIDKDWRTPLLDWWPNEELDTPTLRDVVEFFIRMQPRFVVTHDCPLCIYPELAGKGVIIPNNTALALDMMYLGHKPEKWYFGHWHQTKEILHKDGTLFRCLAEYEAYEDPDIADFGPDVSQKITD